MDIDPFFSPPGPSDNWDCQTFSKVICFVGSDVSFGLSAIDILLFRQVEIVAVVGKSAAIIYDQLAEKYNIKSTKIISATIPWNGEVLRSLVATEKLLGVSCGMDYIIPIDILRAIPIINCHPSFLPYNRGCHHSFWAIMDSSPMGATLHWMSAGLDQGAIIAQKTFDDDGYSSAAVIQAKSNLLCLELLADNITNVMEGKITSSPQDAGTYHPKTAIVARSTLNISEYVSVGYLLKLCRATSNKDNGFIINSNQKKIKIIVKLEVISG